MGKQCFRLGGPEQFAAKRPVIQGLFAKTVAGDDELFSPCVPERERVHPVEVIHEVLAVLFVKVRQYLGVGLGNELVTTFFEVGADLAVVIQLAVHHHDDRLVLAKDRLVAGVQIDDREPPHPQGGSVVQPQPLGIWPAMHDGLAHRMQHRLGVVP